MEQQLGEEQLGMLAAANGLALVYHLLIQNVCHGFLVVTWKKVLTWF